MYSSLFRHVLFPLYESTLRRRSTLQSLAELEESQWRSRDATLETSFRRLVEALRHAERHVPFYRKRFAEFGVRADRVQAPEDLAAFPIVTKDDVRADPKAFWAENFHGQLHRSATGGSTGQPMVFHYDHETYERRIAAAIRSNRWAGAEIGEKELHIWGYPPAEKQDFRTTKRALQQFLWRQKYISSFHLRSDKLDNALRDIVAFEPRVIIGYTMPLFLLARAALENRFVLPTLRGVITSAERLFDHQRDIIERGFRAPVFDRYGCREVMLIGAECEQHAGLHINAENVFVELYQNNRPVATGLPGEVLVSDLVNRAMPLLRYRNDDVATAKPGVCPCGRGLPLLASIDGRMLDMISGTQGRIVAGEAFVHLLKDFPIERFQAHQRADRSITLRIVPARDFTPQQKTEIDQRMREVLGFDANFTVQIVRDIELTVSGKHRVTTSEVPIALQNKTPVEVRLKEPSVRATNKVRVAHVVLSLRPGGLERVVLQLVEHLDRERYEPIVVALEERGEFASELSQLGVELHVLPRQRAFDTDVVARLANLFEQQRISIVHTHNPTPHLYGSVASSIVRARSKFDPLVVHTKHGRNHPTELRKVVVNRVATAMSERIVAVSEDALRVAIDIERIEPHRVVVIRNGVDTRKVCPSDRRQTRARLGIEEDVVHVGSVARLCAEKDHATLLEAFALLRRRVSNTRLTLVGDGPLRGSLQETAVQLGIRDVVTFAGHTNDVAAILPSFDLFALASRTEGTSLTLLEAAAAGLPIVATAVGGNAEIVIDGESGRLVPVAQPAMFADAMEQVVMRADRMRMGEVGRAVVLDRYDLAKTVAAYATLYAEVLRLG